MRIAARGRFLPSVLILVIGLAGSANAIDTNTPFVGTFDGHLLAGTPGCTTTTTDTGKDARVAVTFDCSAGAALAGLIHGTVTIDFPATTPIAHYDSAGTHLVFDAPVVTHMTADYIWTALNKSNNDGQLTLDAFDSDQSADAAQCSFDSGDKKVSGGSTTDFHGSIDCVWTSVPNTTGGSVPFSNVPFTILQSDSTFFAFSGGGGEYAAHSFVSSYTFSQAAPPTADLSVDHIEVVQTVQSPINTWPLVVGKSAVVRVYPKLTDTNTAHTSLAGVTASLRGFHGTTELPGSPLTRPFNPGGTITVVLAPDGAYTDQTINFLLPLDWTAAGELTLTATINPNHTVGETNYANNSASSLEPLPHFFETKNYEVDYVPVCYLDFAHCPANAISTYDALARELYPITDTHLTYARLKVPRLVYPFLLQNSRDESSMIAFLQLLYDLTDAVGKRPDQLVGWLPAIESRAIHEGFSDPIYDGGRGEVLFAQELSGFEPPGTPPDLNLSSYVLAHEAGHNLGLRHTDIAPDGDGCGAWDVNSDFAKVYDDHKATIHDLGFSTLDLVAIPKTAKDLMTSCVSPMSNLWISGFQYERLMGVFGIADAPQAQIAPSDSVLVTGQAKDDASTGRIDSVLRVSSSTSPPPSDPTGNHCLRFASGDGTLLSQYCFRLTFDTTIRADGSGEHLDAQSFSVKAAFPAGTAKITLLAGTTELASVSQSGHAPVIAITSPAAGDVWSGSRTLVWTASDADGDPLRFTVLTSPDDGSTWIPVATNLTATQYTVESAELAAGAQTLLKVLASDGFETTAATVGPVTITPQAFLQAAPELRFGSVAPGGHSTHTVLVTNGGDLDAHVTSIASGNPEFASSATVPVSVPANGSVEIPLTFTPSASGPVSSTLNLSTDDPQRPSLVVALSGGGCVPQPGVRCATPVSAGPPKMVSRGGP